MIPEKVTEFCAEHALLPKGCRVLCACSGGADSTALLHMLCATDGISVVCAHFNHGLRAAESDRDEAFVREMSQRLGVGFVRGGCDVAAYAAAHGVGTEAAARTLRYAFLEQAAKDRGCDRIATAHNAQDNAETVLLNLIRGSGLRGLCGIPPQRGQIVRPLLRLSRAEIEAYLAENGLDHVEDSSNAADDYARNRVRHRILPLLTQENPAAAEHIAATAELLREDEEYLSGLAENFIMTQQAHCVSVSQLLALPKPVGVRVVLRLCGAPSRQAANAIFALCNAASPHGSVSLPGMRVVREYDRLCFGVQAGAGEIACRELTPGEFDLPGTPLHIRCTQTVYRKEIHNSFNTFCFKSENICDRLYVTSRKEGDSIRLMGRGCSKTLKKLFSEARLPLDRRQLTPVIRDDGGVAAVYGFGIAQRLAPAEGDAVFCVEITEKEKM